jgi:protein-disulfide isomerase
MIDCMKKVLILAAALSVLSCSPASSQQAGGNDPAARIGDRVVTIKELEDRWRASNPGDHAEVTQKLYEGRRTALEELVAESLIAKAAEGSGMSPAAWAEAEVSKRVKPVPESEVVAFYQGNISQMQGRALDVMAPAIRRYLTEQQETTARQALLSELRRSAPDVRVLFDAPRHSLEVAASDPSLGSASAPVTLVEFSDFQCPFCQRVAPTLKQVKDKYGDRVRIVWKDFPLTQIHPQAFKASEAAHCAGDQGKFWEYHDRLFSNQQALEIADLKRYAGEMSLDAAKFADCLDTSKYGERVRDGVAQGTTLGVNSTPMIYINGRVLSGAQPYEAFAALIDEELARGK